MVQQEKLLDWRYFHVQIIALVVGIDITACVTIKALLMEPPAAHQTGAGIAWKDKVAITSAAVTFLLGHSLHCENLLSVLDSGGVLYMRLTSKCWGDHSLEGKGVGGSQDWSSQRPGDVGGGVESCLGGDCAAH